MPSGNPLSPGRRRRRGTLADTIGAIPNAEDFDFYRCQALIHEAEFAGDGRRDIQHTARNEWAAVVQANRGRASIFEVSDSDFAGERESLVGGRAGPRPDLFACRSSAGKNKSAFIVVGADAGIHMTEGLARLHRLVVDAANRVGFGFIAFHRWPNATREGHEEQREAGLQRSKECFFHDAGRGFSKSIAALREVGMRPQ